LAQAPSSLWIGDSIFGWSARIADEEGRAYRRHGRVKTMHAKVLAKRATACACSISNVSSPDAAQ
jgi:hypothetical protein